MGARARRATVATAVVVAVAAAGSGTWFALRSDAPTVLGDSTGGATMIMDPLPTGESTTVAGLAFPSSGNLDEVLRFHARPVVHFTTNTAAATGWVAVCTRADGRTPIGAGHLALARENCARLRAVRRGTTLRWVEGTDSNTVKDYLVLVVSPTRPGEATVDRVTYDYEEPSGNSGTDVGSISLTVRAS